MSSNLRKNIRFEDFGKVECSEICLVAGVLDDISVSGCKVHFDAPVTINMEDDYELKIRLSRINLDPFILLCHPQWQKEDNGTTEVGFSILHSLDTSRLESYIEQLHTEKESLNNDLIMVEDDTCLFV
ncbi:MAG: PilZ domain-containing protein [Treponema sp.]|nr:PilZ domain-containing protein [Treponema sp.]MBP3607651.1 PilZ domain-containing protein [Treponema sp.]MBQ7882455.1 PilZ domain-containing protein [Treponema sp.]